MGLAIKNQKGLIFIITTLVFIITRFILFQGLNGTDDLHYAMLPAKLLKGHYNPFEPADIFSGRILLISWQALIYKVAGVSVFTTCIGTIIAVIISCWLVVYKMMSEKTATTTLLACSLFYFNPTLTESTRGILPDAYIMLVGIIVFLLLRPTLLVKSSEKKYRVKYILIGIIIATTLLIKETVLVFVPFATLIGFVYRGKKSLLGSLYILLSFTLMVALLALSYYYFTGNAFIKILQIKNSAYDRNSNLFIRLTVGVYEQFITSGFYPVVLCCIVILIKFCKWKKIDLQTDLWIISFCLLLSISLYFPFSLKDYQPLPSESRHFLFLLPFAVIVVTNSLYYKNKEISDLLVSVFLLLTLIACTITTGNKWQWMIYGFLSGCFICAFFSSRFSRSLKQIILVLILFISIFENMFFLKKRWFQDMQQLSKQLHSDYYYFSDHDYMMHWKLLHQFNDTTFTYYNLQRNQFKFFTVYYKYPDSSEFHPGWMIMNKHDPAMLRLFPRHLNSLQAKNYFSVSIVVGELNAYYLKDQQQLFIIKNIIAESHDRRL